jgi:GTPase SAR1 family protein
VQQEFSLGPNSSFLYCFDFLEKNLNWLGDKIIDFSRQGKKYLIIDTPGQIEIFTQAPSFKKIIKFLTNQKEMDTRLCVVNLIESSNLLDLPRYIFSIFSVLNAMINLEQPQINLISKIDLLKEFISAELPSEEGNNSNNSNNGMAFPLSFYKNPNDVDMLTEILDSLNINPKFKKLNKLISEFVIDYGLVSFDTINVQNQKHLNKVATLIDKANGYIYLDTGSLADEKYIEIRNQIAKNDLDFENEDDLE